MEQGAGRRLTGRQIVIIVVALCAAVVLAPVGVFAAAHAQRVSLSDAKHPSRTVAVTSSRRLEVAGPVTGTVNARPLPPSKPFNLSITQYVGESASITLPKGHTVVVQNISTYFGDTIGGGDSGGLLATYRFKGTTQTESLPSPLSGVDFFGTSPVTIYADPGSTMQFAAQSNLAPNYVVLSNVTISGYTT